MIKYLVLLCVLTGCSAPGQIVHTGSDGTTIGYSQYLQDKVDFEGLRVHTIIALGKERLPSGYKFSAKDRRYLKSADGAIEAVLEVYITNLGVNTIQVNFTDIQTGRNSYRRGFSANSHSISPKAFVKSPPIVRTSSVYQPLEKDYVLTLSINGVRKELRGTLHRTPITELEKDAN